MKSRGREDGKWTVLDKLGKTPVASLSRLKPENTKRNAVQPFSHDGKCKPLTQLPCFTCLILILNSVLYWPCEL